MIDSDLQNLKIRDYKSAKMHVKVKHPYVVLHENPYWASGYVISLADFINSQICKVCLLSSYPARILSLLPNPSSCIPSSLWCFDSLVESVLSDKVVSSHSGSWQLPQLWQLKPICVVRRVLSCTFTVKCIKL